ncbi:MAG: aminotransferase class I/II-fold pyridoxal phosphate-dependent enzyme, partial [Lentisphaeria bacterium]|nr:aminotransferase class I/II-fold pyridoxal phosphate-dependent enzyme [Lentisphaeria bacterium]
MTVEGLSPTNFAYDTGVASLPEPTSPKPYWLFDGWYDNDGRIGDPVTSIAANAIGNVTLYAKWIEDPMRKTSVTFQGASGEQTENCRVLDTTVTELEDGWYVVTNDLEYAAGLSVTGNVNLVLVDGMTLSITNGTYLSRKAGINVPAGNSLTIYGQANGTGAIEAYGANWGAAGIGGNHGESCGAVTVYGGVVIANPNAPTSIAESADFIEDIVRHNPDSVVVVDEAYVDFGAESVLKLTEKYENLLVVRTFSKSRSMAGIRIGYAIGSPKLIATMNAVKQSINSYTMNHITIALGVASVEDDAYFKSVLAKVMKTREDATKRLRAMGFIVPDSKTNFLFAEYPGVPGEYIFTELKKRNIYVRWWPKERIKNRLRITIGTDAEMETVYKEIEKILAEYKTK